jgi:hypothetical protein
MISILRNSAHEGAAVSFVKFLLRSSSEGILSKGGVAAKTPPVLSGKAMAIPTPLRSLLTS